MVDDIFSAFEDIDELLAMAPDTEPPVDKPKLPGEPGRTNPAPHSLQVLAREYTQEAVDTILLIMRSPLAEASTRLEAAKEILNRGWGKSAIKADITTTHISVHAELKQLAATLPDPPKLGVGEEVHTVQAIEVTDAPVHD